ncbi:phosphatidylglycerol lysyltransferase domain-containing protein [Peribacillus tepidiphilus]|uniref:phosphatidylglycerol lysyltransferase domain-containing protein n=1 Tax=Peribacillus tepidiphilus TaxID=2652445 RepID=UPI0012925E05|nr:phosphatidylglycerol lysyltransferase domain-containing protein [Peribacillus tepidiphilus]
MTVSDSWLEADYHLFKLGEEARVPLHDFSLAGKKGAKLRTRKNKFERNGYQFMVVHPPYTDEFVIQKQVLSTLGAKVFSLSEMFPAYFVGPDCVLDPSQKRFC